MEKLLAKVYNELSGDNKIEFIKLIQHLLDGIKDVEGLNQYQLLYHHQNIGFDRTFYGNSYTEEELLQIQEYIVMNMDIDKCVKYMKIHRKYYNDPFKIKRKSVKQATPNYSDKDIPLKYRPKCSMIKKRAKNGYYDEQTNDLIKRMSPLQIYNSDIFKQCRTNGEYRLVK